MEIVEGMECTTPKRSHTWTQLPYHEPRWNQPPPLREMSSDHDVAGDRAAMCETPCAPPPTAETARKNHNRKEPTRCPLSPQEGT